MYYILYEGLKIESNEPVYCIYQYIYLQYKKKKNLFPLGLEPRTFRVLGERDDHYTTETVL